MTKNGIRGTLLSLVLLIAPGTARGQMLGTSARQMPKGSLKILVFYQGVQGQAVDFSVRGGAGCSTANNISFACADSGEVEAEGSGGAGMVKLVYQPWESFQYYAAVGAGDYTLRVPSATLTNVLTGDNPGLTWAAGLKAVLHPDTIVTPALAVDASVSRSRYYFNRRFPGGTPGQSNNVSQRLDLWQYQVAFEASHLFTIVEKSELLALKDGVKLEPYGGLKWLRTQADLKDLADGSHAGGQHDAVSPFLGLRIPVYDHEGLFAEASFVGGTQYAAGLEIRF